MSDRAADAAYKVINNLRLLPLRSDVITVTSVWDELRLDVEIEYSGPTIELADSLPAIEEMSTETGIAHLAGYLVRRYADCVRIREKNGICRVLLPSTTDLVPISMSEAESHSLASDSQRGIYAFPTAAFVGRECFLSPSPPSTGYPPKRLPIPSSRVCLQRFCQIGCQQRP